MEDYLSDTKSPSEKLLMLFRPCLDKNNRISSLDIVPAGSLQHLMGHTGGVAGGEVLDVEPEAVAHRLRERVEPLAKGQPVDGVVEFVAHEKAVLPIAVVHIHLHAVEQQRRLPTPFDRADAMGPGLGSRIAEG